MMQQPFYNSAVPTTVMQQPLVQPVPAPAMTRNSPGSLTEYNALLRDDLSKLDSEISKLSKKNK